MNEHEQNMPPEIKDVVMAAQTALYDEEFDAVFQKSVAETNSFSAAAAIMCANLLEQAQEYLKVQLTPEQLYADKMASDYVMDAIYEMGQRYGIEEATNQESYNAALDLVEQQGMEAANAPQEPQQPRQMLGA